MFDNRAQQQSSTLEFVSNVRTAPQANFMLGLDDDRNWTIELDDRNRHSGLTKEAFIRAINNEAYNLPIIIGSFIRPAA